VKVFFGLRTDQGYQVFTWDTLAPARPVQLDQARELRDHSTTGFAWGYGGSGPAQLALAMLYEATGNQDFSLCLYQDLKFTVVSKLEGACWSMSEEQLLKTTVSIARTPEMREAAVQQLAASRARRRKQGEKVDG
jgi:hypothetical protein